MTKYHHYIALLFAFLLLTAGTTHALSVERGNEIMVVMETTTTAVENSPETDTETFSIVFKNTQPIPVVRDKPLPTDEFWDKMAWCETHQDWQNGGQWAGGLGIYTKSEFPKSDMGTWERFGGEEFAPSPDKASREQQIIIANRVAVLGWSKEMTHTPEQAKRMGVPINWTWDKPAVGFRGWGALHCATKSPIKSPKNPPLFYHEDLTIVLAMSFVLGQQGIEVHDLQGIVGAKQDGVYGPITHKLHLVYLEKN